VRVLFVTRPLVGHYYPMRPLMGALADAGDEVALATGEPLASAAAHDGIVVHRVGLANDDPAVVHNRSILQRLPPAELRRFAFSDWFVLTEMPPRVRDLEAVIDRCDPDLIIHETAEFAAPLVASVHGIPYATHAYGPLLRRDAALSAGTAAAPFWREWHLEPHPYAGLYRHLYLDICPPSLQTADIADIDAVQQVGPPSDQVQGPPPPWLGDLTRQPIVYVTLGTVFNRDHRVFSTVLEGLQQHAVNVVVTVGPNNDPASLGVQPPNVRVHRFIEQDQLLPLCSMAVVHGGAGTTFGALSWGVPLVVVPQSADQFFNAEQVAAAGAGIALMPDDQNADSVHEAARALLHDDTFRNAARRVQHEFAAMPLPAEVRDTLQDLAERRRQD
jgi:UDP:flavonoid glycosyltransferase YjiC (YdhE family)